MMRTWIRLGIPGVACAMAALASWQLLGNSERTMPPTLPTSDTSRSSAAPSAPAGTSSGPGITREAAPAAKEIDPVGSGAHAARARSDTVLPEQDRIAQAKQRGHIRNLIALLRIQVARQNEKQCLELQDKLKKIGPVARSIVETEESAATDPLVRRLLGEVLASYGR